MSLTTGHLTKNPAIVGFLISRAPRAALQEEGPHDSAVGGRRRSSRPASHTKWRRGTASASRAYATIAASEALPSIRPRILRAASTVTRVSKRTFGRSTRPRQRTPCPPQPSTLVFVYPVAPSAHRSLAMVSLSSCGAMMVTSLTLTVSRVEVMGSLFGPLLAAHVDELWLSGSTRPPSRWAVVVVKHSMRRRLEVVELTASRSPKEGGDGPKGGEECERHEHEEDGHFLLPKVRDRYELVMTPIELTGINTAASSGPTRPPAARDPTQRL